MSDLLATAERAAIAREQAALLQAEHQRHYEQIGETCSCPVLHCGTCGGDWTECECRPGPLCPECGERGELRP